jgi:uncharacterized RDD family membrane protein YckC
MTQWYYTEGGRQHGPIPEDVLCSMLDSGKITRETPVWRVGLPAWRKMGELPPEQSPLPPPLVEEPPPPPPAPPEPVMAGFGLRLAAIVLDLLVLGLVIVVFFIAGVVFHGEIQEPSDMLCWVYLGLAISLVVFYFAGLEGSRQQATWGKQAMEIRVVRQDGQPLGFAGSVRRFAISLFLVIITGGISFLLILFSRKRQTLHDKMAGTLVIKG